MFKNLSLKNKLAISASAAIILGGVLVEARKKGDIGLRGKVSSGVLQEECTKSGVSDGENPE